MKAEAGWNWSAEQAEQPLTYPELVAEFHRFLSFATDTLTREAVISQAVIAIDEVDKLPSSEAARDFVNSIKGIFGAPNCLFLVSVSADALTSFERRGIPMREDFESAFTEMVHVDYFDLDDTREWLGRAIVDLSEGIACLCHCVSGGLGRELHRIALALDDLDNLDDPTSEIAEHLIALELPRKVEAFSAAAQELRSGTEVVEFIATLSGIRDAMTPDQLMRSAGELAPASEHGELDDFGRLRWESACYLHFCATVLEVFGDGSFEPHDSQLTDPRQPKPADLEILARARQAMATHPLTALGKLSDFRERVGLEQIRLPAR